MSLYTHEIMTINHGSGVLAQLREILHVWRQRYQSRHELSQWTDRDLHDVGLSWSDIADEAAKPFWRA